ncbi:MAG: type II toxin-antitoxin system RelE/ParE family toxin [Dehalococcoidales bacterium]|nr:type II toxin-antitoxin system RelE/ParE family toxin [Dehalococcoidales bacterium]
MAGYSIYFKASVKKDLNSISRHDIIEILQRIEKLAIDPRPPVCKKLTGQNRYRLRQGNYRIIYSIQDSDLCVWIIKIGHRKDVYR